MAAVAASDARPAAGVVSTALGPELETLSISSRGEVGVLTLDRPEQLNAMSPTMLRELPVATAWLADEAPFRAIVLSGAGDSFSLGGDLDALRELLEDPAVDIAADCRTRIDQLHQAILNLRRIAVPVVAAVDGIAAGSGF